MMKADLLQERNDTGGSITTLERARVYAPGNEELCFSLAFKYAQAREARCIGLCDSLIRQDSADRRPEPFYFKGVYFSNIGESSKAIAMFDRAIATDYSFLDAYMAKGKLLHDSGKFVDALKVFRLATTVSPTFADAYFWQAKCEAGLGKKDEAALDYDRAYGLDKSMTEARDAAAKLRAAH
jgi:tetratricopeptide (TPR) repeat protein